MFSSRSHHTKWLINVARCWTVASLMAFVFSDHFTYKCQFFDLIRGSVTPYKKKKKKKAPSHDEQSWLLNLHTMFTEQWPAAIITDSVDTVFDLRCEDNNLTHLQVQNCPSCIVYGERTGWILSFECRLTACWCAQCVHTITSCAFPKLDHTACHITISVNRSEQRLADVTDRQVQVKVFDPILGFVCGFVGIHLGWQGNVFFFFCASAWNKGDAHKAANAQVCVWSKEEARACVWLLVDIHHNQNDKKEKNKRELNVLFVP